MALVNPVFSIHVETPLWPAKQLIVAVNETEKELRRTAKALLLLPQEQDELWTHTSNACTASYALEQAKLGQTPRIIIQPGARFEPR